jgi:hypothetical protein
VVVVSAGTCDFVRRGGLTSMPSGHLGRLAEGVGVDAPLGMAHMGLACAGTGDGVCGGALPNMPSGHSGRLSESVGLYAPLGMAHGGRYRWQGGGYIIWASIGEMDG